MKKLAYTGLAIAALLMSQSCGKSGWTPDKKQSSHKICKMGMDLVYPDDAQSICDCYISKLVERYPNVDQSSQQSDLVLTECASDAQKKDVERRINESVQTFDNRPDKVKKILEKEN